MHRVAILSSAGSGGAGYAARRLAESLRRHGDVTVDFLDGERLGGLLPNDVAPARSFSNHVLSDTHFTVEYPGYQRGWLTGLLEEYDLINVHWASMLVSLGELDTISRRGKPVLFMLHDFHYITGGCHYPATCTRYRRTCMNCPQVDRTEADSRLLSVNLDIKRAIFARPNVHLMAPSRYLRDEAVRAGIVPHARAHLLRNPYLPEPIAPVDRQGNEVRIALVADSLGERRKNMALAVHALKALENRRRQRQFSARIVLDVVGKSNPELTKLLKGTGLKVSLNGRITDHRRLAQILANSHLLLTCSSEDNWPNVLVEAGSYGCAPVVGPGHGCEEFVRTYSFGAVASDYSADAFAEAMEKVIATQDANASEAAKWEIRRDHDPARIVREYLQIADAMCMGRGMASVA